MRDTGRPSAYVFSILLRQFEPSLQARDDYGQMEAKIDQEFKYPVLVVNLAGTAFLSYELDPIKSPIKIYGSYFVVDPELREERLLAQALAFSKISFYYCFLKTAVDTMFVVSPKGKIINLDILPGKNTIKASVEKSSTEVKMMSEMFEVVTLIQQMLRKKGDLVIIDNDDLGTILSGIKEKGVAVVGHGENAPEAMRDAIAKVEKEIERPRISQLLIYFCGATLPFKEVEVAAKLFTEPLSEDIDMIWGCGTECGTEKGVRVLVICGS